MSLKKQIIAAAADLKAREVGDIEVIDQISAAFGVDKDLVELALNAAGEIETDNIDNEKFRQIQERVMDIGLHSDDENLVVRVHRNLLDHRREVAINKARLKQGIPTGISLHQINLLIRNANEHFNDSLRGRNRETIALAGPEGETDSTIAAA